jgi:hypothetical protein
MSTVIKEARPSAQLADFVIVGFPKCGTTAVVRALDRMEGVQADWWDGAVEAPYMLNERNLQRLYAARQDAAPSSIVGHKFSAYIYSIDAIKRIHALVPGALLIVCVRDPMRALLSWREMHKVIANNRAITGHFVTESEQTRAFYASASLEEYYRQFARENLRYAHYVRRLIELTADQRIAIVSQEWLSVRRAETLGVLADLLGAPAPESGPSTSRPHKAFADEAQANGLSPESLEEVAVQGRMLGQLLDELRSPTPAWPPGRITVLAGD